MALTIEGATVGYDKAGVDQLMEDIRAHVIEDAANKMEGSLETLNTSVDEVWAGHSADTFKKNMRTDVDNIKKALNSTYDALKSEVAQIVRAMGEVDQELIQAR